MGCEQAPHWESRIEWGACSQPILFTNLTKTSTHTLLNSVNQLR